MPTVRAGSRRGCRHHRDLAWQCPSFQVPRRPTWVSMSGAITVFLADDNLIVREGVRALLSMEPDVEVVGVAADYDELVTNAGAAAPQVLVSDIRMPPTFQREGI